MLPPARKLIRIVLPVAISAALLLWLALHIDFTASISLLQSLPLTLTLPAVLLVFIGSIISSLRFWLLVKPHYAIGWRESAGLNLLTVLSAHGFGLLSDGLRVHYLMRFGASLRQSIDLTLADRLLSLWLFALCTLLLLPCALMSILPYAYPFAAVGIALLLAGAWLCSQSYWPAWLQPCLTAFTASIGNARTLLFQLGCALLCCVALAGAYIMLAQALGFNLPIPVALALSPASVLISSLPFTYAGLGAREAAFVFGLPLLTPIAPEQAAALSLSYALILLLANTPGLLFIPQMAKK